MSIAGVVSTAGTRTWGDRASYDVTSEFTMSCWIKTQSNDTSVRSVFMRGASSGAGGREIDCNSGAATHSIVASARIAGGARTTPTASGLAVATWHLAVLRYHDGVTPLELIVDGVSAGSTAGTGTIAASATAFTASVWNTDNLYKIAECASWGVCLGDADVASLLYYSPSLVCPESLHLYDPCISSAINEYSITSATDSDSGTVNNDDDHPSIIYPLGAVSVMKAGAAAATTSNGVIGGGVGNILIAA